MSTISTNKSREPVKYEREGQRQVVVWLWYAAGWDVVEDRGDDACGNAAALVNGVVKKGGEPTVFFSFSTLFEVMRIIEKLINLI